MAPIQYELLEANAPNPADSVHELTSICVIQCQCGGFLLQLRDDIEGIWFPGMWGGFGGSLEPGESPVQAMQRELEEELGILFTGSKPQFFCYVLHKYEAVFKVEHIFFYRLPCGLDDLVLQEGQQMACLSYEEIVSGSAFSSLLQEHREVAGPIVHLFLEKPDLGSLFVGGVASRFS